jgi:hypothetical protein
MSILGRIGTAIFGGRASVGRPNPPSHGGEPEEKQSAKYGTLAEGRNMARELERDNKKEEAQEEGAKVPVAHYSTRYWNKPMRRSRRGMSRDAFLGERFIRGHLRELSEDIEGAGERGKHSLFQMERRELRQTGEYHHLVKHMEQARDKRLEELKDGGASDSDVRRFESKWQRRYGKPLRKMGFTLRRSRLIRT